MRYALALLSTLLCVSSCNNNSGLSTDAIAENNVSNLSRISVGMSQSQISYIMRKPYRQESIKHGDDVYDVWFYITRMTALGQTRMVPQNLTPLVFQDGLLVGWGFGYYNRMKSSISQETPPQEKFHKEDRSLEKTLQVPKNEAVKPQTPPAVKEPKSPQPQKLEQAPKDEAVKPQTPPVIKEPKNPQSQTPPAIKEPEDLTSMQTRPPKEEPPQEPPPPEKPYIDDKGEKMIEEENEQNFDFW